MLLLASNIIFLFLFLNVKKQEAKSSVEIFTLSGEGTYWSVDNYKVIRTNNSIWRGSAGLNYLGNEKDIADSDYFSYQFVEVNKNSDTETVLVESNSSTNGGVNILGNIDKLGSISGLLSSREKQMTIDDLKKSYLNITWTNSNGDEKSERIELNITDHIELK